MSFKGINEHYLVHRPHRIFVCPKEQPNKVFGLNTMQLSLIPW